MAGSDAKTDLETRKASAASIRAKHPDRIPVIVDKRGGDTSLPDIDKVPQLLLIKSLSRMLETADFELPPRKC